MTSECHGICHIRKKKSNAFFKISCIYFETIKKDCILILSMLLFLYVTTTQSPLTVLTWLDVFYVNLTSDFQVL